MNESIENELFHQTKHVFLTFIHTKQKYTIPSVSWCRNPGIIEVYCVTKSLMSDMCRSVA